MSGLALDVRTRQSVCMYCDRLAIQQEQLTDHYRDLTPCYNHTVPPQWMQILADYPSPGLPSFSSDQYDYNPWKIGPQSVVPPQLIIHQCALLIEYRPLLIPVCDVAI